MRSGGGSFGRIGLHVGADWWTFLSTYDDHSPILALDPFTLAALKAHVEQLKQERRDFGPGYHDHGVLFCWPDGRPPHPDTITRRFKKLAAAAGLPDIDLHDVRHSYATAV